ncbi:MULTISPECIES: FtsX-like permease family protein [Acidobacterium]|nr:MULTISPECIES: FtsX-like permease family protein [Acidobacterium]
MMKPALPWSTAFRIGMRELRASRAKFLFVLLSVAIGVAALTGVRGFSQSFQRALLGQARGLMAADLSASLYHTASPAQVSAMNALAQHGVEMTQTMGTVSMAQAVGHPVPILVSLKAVDPGKYPFYGNLVLKPAGPLPQLLNDHTVLVDDNLLVRLHAQVGDQLKIGGKLFRIAAVIVSEPDRLSAGVGFGPRVMMTRHMLDETGLVQMGSRASVRYLFKVPKGTNIAALKAKLQQILPQAQVEDYRETNPSLTAGLDHATGLLSLICLVAMVLGAIGVGMAMRAHLQQRIEVLAIMKSIGARSSDILRIYLLQTILLGAAGALLGVLLGVGVEFALPTVFGKLLPLKPALTLPIGPVLAAFGTGILTTVLFCLPPLLDVRKIRPVVVLRRAVETGFAGRGWRGWLRENRLQLFSILVILAGLGGIAVALSDSWLVGRWFTICLASLLAFLLALSSGFLRLLRMLLRRTRAQLPSALRHGLANLYRPGNQSGAVLAALGAGVMLILSVFLMQHSIVLSLRADAPPSLPNVFLVDIGSDQLQGLKHLVEAQPGILGKLETVPIVQGYIESIDGVPEKTLASEHYPRHLLREVGMTWSAKQLPDTEVTAGKWWTSDTTDEVALDEYIARRLKVHPGSSIVFSAGDTTIATHVAVIFKTKGNHAFSRADYVLPPHLLKPLPAIWYADMHVKPSEIPQLERVLFAAYPTITVVNVADILDTISNIVDQITVVIHFLAAFSILSGLVILASSIASTRFRRIREVVVLKTLGATRRRVALVFSIEFAVLGLLAGTVGVLFAQIMSSILLKRLHVPFAHSYTASILTIAANVVLAVFTGWIASFRILGQRPLEVLREE